MINDNLYNKELIIKPTSLCNFNCSFCSAKLLDIPIHNKVPEVLRDYILNYKPNNLIISGGEPLINPQSYFEDLFNIMDNLNIEYEVNFLSNLILWYENPEKYDWIFNKPNVSVDTSFQYGSDRKDENIYTEERFIKVYNKFYNRYNKPLLFTYVVNKNNEKFLKDACILAKKLNTDVKFNCQIPMGKSNEYYPKYKLFSILLELKKEGILDKNSNTLESIRKHYCPFSTSYKYCLNNKAVYVDKNEKLVEGHCEEQLSSGKDFKIEKGMLFKKCLYCPMFTICNGCSINRKHLNPIKEDHCNWMIKNYKDLKKYNII